MDKIEYEAAPKDLKCTVVITGREGDGEASINIEFDPPIGGEGKKHWDDSGVEIVAGVIMEALSKAKASE